MIDDSDNASFDIDAFEQLEAACEAAGESGPDLCTHRPYRHPFQNRPQLRDGGIPLLDVQDSPTGGRYAAVDGVHIAAEGADPELFSGIIELEVEKQRGPAAPADPPLPPVIRDSLQAELDARAGTRANDELLIRVEFSHPREPMMQHLMERAAAMGELETEWDAIAKRHELTAAKRERIAGRVNGDVKVIEALGAKIVERCGLQHCATVLATPSTIDQLARHPRVSRLGLEYAGRETEDSDFAVTDEVHNMDQFEVADYEGFETSTSCAIAEGDGYNFNHKAFFTRSNPSDMNSPLVSRIIGKIDCTASPCNTNWTPIPADSHAHRVASIVFSDFDYNQSSAYTTETEQDRRSSPASRARCYLYRRGPNGNAGDLNRLWDHMNGPSTTGVEVVNGSFGYFPSYASGDNCSGTDTLSKDVNELLYEQGILYIKSAGNDEETEDDKECQSTTKWKMGSATNCSVNSPAAALGVFTVGAMGGTANLNGCQAHDSPVWSTGVCGGSSAWGGNVAWSPTSPAKANAYGRTVIDLMAWSRRTNVANWNSDTLATHGFSGTSSATPTVTSSALAYIDHYVDLHGSLIRDPGILFANLLLQGDRVNDAGTKMSSGFDNHTGAGRLMMRMRNAAGMDEPYWAGSFSTCVGQNEVVHFSPTRGAVESTIDDFKAVAYWYDARNHDTGALANIDLKLYTDGALRVTSASTTDNKERVFYTGPYVGGKTVTLDIIGTSVSSTLPDVGCGVGKMRVHVAYLLEDKARDDANGPSWNATTCTGVEPESAP